MPMHLLKKLLPTSLLRPLRALRIRFGWHPKDNFWGFRQYRRPLLITYARSGTNWLRYCVEQLTGRPAPGLNRAIDSNSIVMDRAHMGFRVAHKYDRVILLIRNPLECLLRHHGTDTALNFPGGLGQFLQARHLPHPPHWFIDNLAAYHAHPGPKLLVLYEDLILRPQTTLARVGEFFQVPAAQVEALVSELPQHKARSLAEYQATSHQSATQGQAKMTKSHQAGLSVQEKESFWAYYRTQHPTLFKTYLAHYPDTPDR